MSPTRVHVAVVRLASDPTEPIVLQFVDATLEVLVGRMDVIADDARIDKSTWAVTGVYVLLGPPSSVPPGDSAPVVTGRARAGLSSDVLERVRDHRANVQLAWATRAVLARDTRQGFNRAQAGYLEGRLHDLLLNAEGVQRIGTPDHDTTLQPHEERELDRRYLPHICATLELVGVPLDEDVVATLESMASEKA